ncbi:alpha/beta hydrolase [Ensifer adhaerens]|uniref:alpha/beta fold hydrolase n=1 Tax=Ensifer adhaerens TaxID=106592 RepID=UPI001CBE6B23|nr:alpha/beta hydrolase [Ensifer adhaerens]MBZ7920850.1 alpha/beta hydrolase [Ensifer adhaerens]UAX93303.1 alpha/beta hydrolase [Ensifer adhaerens]UAY00940.1 alpha/beta hydrolase [Ensifer adhaerens]UAY08321.1 alpha/beta hydrolase [Ensifer adhaerens]
MTTKNGFVSETGSLRAGPFDLGYTIEGSGMPLLVIGSAIYYPRTFSKALREKLRLVFVDHRGFAPARGEYASGDIGFETVLADIDRLRAHLGLERFAILGHSGHGYMALEYAKRHPGHISHLVMVGTGPSHSARHMAVADRIWEETVSPERKATFEREMAALGADIAARPEERFKSLLIRLGAKSWHQPDFDAAPLWLDVTVNNAVFDHLWGEVFRDIDIRKGLNALTAPVLLALGRSDYLVAPASTWDEYRGDFADLTVRTFEESGHTPQLEESDHFDEVLLSFLGKDPG